MKRNMVPLLGIAFVVAIISTGVFYGLFAGRLRSSSPDLASRAIVVAARNLDRGKPLEIDDLRVAYIRGALGGSFAKPEELVGATLMASIKENEPLLEDRVALAGSGPGGSARGVPTGMRAISIRVSDSDGVAGLVKPGAKIDIQAVSERNGVSQLRTILQNVEVLSVVPPTDANVRSGPRVVAVLTRAADADLVALADAASRIRVVVRNPLDEETSGRRALALPSVFQPGTEHAAYEGAQKTPENVAGARDNAREARPTAENPVQLRVKVLAASPQALAELNSKLVAEPAGGQLQVAAFQAAADPGALVETLRRNNQLEIVSSRTLNTARGEPISFRAGAARYRLRLRFVAEAGTDRNAKIRVTPELSVPSGSGVETRQYDAEFDPGARFLVEGLANGDPGRAALERLFPKQSWANRELIIFIDSLSGRPDPVASLAKPARGR